MRRKSLSDLGVANLKPRSQRYAFSDPELRGFYVRVTPNGTKTYVVVSRDPVSRRQVWAALGTADAMKIREARDRARSALLRIREGLPPFEPAPDKPMTFAEVAASWLIRHVAAKKLRSQPEIERCLKVYVYPFWKDRDYAGIKRGDVTSLLDSIEDDRGPRQADAVLAIIRSICNWHAARQNDYVSPFSRGMRRQAPTKRARVLNDQELKVIWHAADSAGAFGAIVKLALLTAQRREKLASMQWKNIVDGKWSIPAGSREKGAGGDLHLPGGALKLIEGQPRIAGNPFVFAGRDRDKNGNGKPTHFAGFSKCKLALHLTLPKLKNADGEECQIERWTIHDLRRTARSLMSRAGVRPDIAERVLGHVIGGVGGVYDRHEYELEKGEALLMLERQITQILRSKVTVEHNGR
jgi:integrase